MPSQRSAPLRCAGDARRRAPEPSATEPPATQLDARKVSVGENFRFGAKAKGDPAMLRSRTEFETRVVPLIEVDGETVSSTRIRALVAAGDVEGAMRCLGAPFLLEGTVVEGDKRGRTLGYPIANIHLQQRVSPIQGIFAVRVGLGEGECSWPGVASLGVRPTVNQVSQPLLEVHLFDFDGNLYGQRMAVEFVAKLRDERKFDGLEPLKAQMALDSRMARELLGMNPRLAEA